MLQLSGFLDNSLLVHSESDVLLLARLVCTNAHEYCGNPMRLRCVPCGSQHHKSPMKEGSFVQGKMDLAWSKPGSSCKEFFSVRYGWGASRAYCAKQDRLFLVEAHDPCLETTTVVRGLYF